MTVATLRVQARAPSLLYPCAVAAIAVGVRLVVAGATVGLAAPPEAEPASDSRIHAALVTSLLGGRGFSLDGEPVATTPPLYVFLLASLYGLGATPSAVRVLQAVLGALDCLLVYLLGRRLFGSRAALLAAGLWAVHPGASYLAGLHLTENLFLPLLLLSLLQAERVASQPHPRQAFLLGALVGLGALARAMFLLFVPVLMVWGLARWGARSAVSYRVMACVAAGCALVLLPWTVRNWVVLRTFAPVQSNGALVFWAGNNPHADGGLVWPTRRTWSGPVPPDDGRYGWRALNVSEENRLYLQEALRWIRDHPAAYAHLLGLKLLRLHSFTRSTDDRVLEVPLAASVFHWALYALAAAGAYLAWRRRAGGTLWALFALTHLAALLFAGSTRYALPMVPAVVLWAGLAASEGWRWATEGAP